MMEYLVAVEIVKDECQSCLKALEVDDTYELFVTAELQEIFADLFGDEVSFNSCDLFIIGSLI